MNSVYWSDSPPGSVSIIFSDMIELIQSLWNVLFATKVRLVEFGKLLDFVFHGTKGVWVSQHFGNDAHHADCPELTVLMHQHSIRPVQKVRPTPTHCHSVNTMIY